MADRDLYLPATPEDAARVVRARALPPGGEVVLSGELDSDAAVGVRLPERALRARAAVGWAADRDAVTAGRVVRAFQPWHADVEPDEQARWRGYLQATGDARRGRRRCGRNDTDPAELPRLMLHWALRRCQS